MAKQSGLTKKIDCRVACVHGDNDIQFMTMALKEAAKAEKIGEVPVGAVIVKDGKIIAKGFNRCITDSDPTAHAEIIALRKAAKKLSNYRLNGCNIYVTIEPCPMCAGALVNARISKIYFGAADKKAGACKSVLKVAGNKKLNHRVAFKGGVLKEECAKIIQQFFKNKRN
ncbi:tRNA adenosine(34) deaminase TadA [Endomicrobium proavitum]|uniref:tRNA-specific adenosine deaminase n=1 Tax=Endomicrobium proavitum TaxID=1408281 RepID=A0A0G3WIR5_9BACT|nr:tRNA adenosine(34) deaminase TadA [Endomicrobium proavitum]AKL97389.1 tRNA-specific adenosine deaminase [Endomicrobium proavitum]